MHKDKKINVYIPEHIRKQKKWNMNSHHAQI